MKGKKTGRAALAILLCLLSFAAGIGAYAAYKAASARPEPEEPRPLCTIEGHVDGASVKLRSDGGTVQWFDGERWNTAAPMQELRSRDALALGLEACHAFEQTLIEEQEAEEPAFRLPQSGKKAVQRTWTPSGGGGGSSGGGGGASAPNNDGSDMVWNGF